MSDRSIVATSSLPARPVASARDARDPCSAHWTLGVGYHTFRARGSTTALVFYTVAGHGFFRSRSGAVHISTPGELTMYEPSVEQEYGTWPGGPAEWEFHWMHLHPRAAWTQWLRLRGVAGIAGLASVVLPDDARDRVVAVWHELHRQLRVGGRWRTELAVNLIERVLLIAAESGDWRGDRWLDVRVRRALDLIARDPSVTHSVASLARTAGLSPSRFAHLFRAQTGLPVKETVLRARMREAEQLLARTSEPVSEIGYRVGFTTPQHFSGQFRRRYGISPRRYRERSRRA